MNETVQTGILASLGINWELFIAQLINFALVVVVVWRFIYRPLLKTMDDRAKKISDGLSDADLAKKQLLEAEEEKKSILQYARKESQSLVAEARDQAEIEKQKVLDASKKDLEKQLEDARARLKRDKESIIKAIKNEMADLVTLATEKVAGASVNAAAQHGLIEKAIDELKEEQV
ncbi:MAG TPA: F0F1 ATP synthase subunit B [Patescibacteria group bacterium]|nr:F0F1 ATP synthase subunit B [Patescibacteria group bacterium]